MCSKATLYFGQLFAEDLIGNGIVSLPGLLQHARSCGKWLTTADNNNADDDDNDDEDDNG